MANDTFATFSEVSALQFNDYLVGYRNLTETRVGYAGLVNTFVAAVSTDNEKINNTYSSLNSFSANWNSAYATVNANSASWEESSEILPTVVNYLSTNNVLLSGLITTTLSSETITTNLLSSRQISLIHYPENDGINPNFFIGETGTNGFSGFNIFYDELQNQLTITSVFSGITGSIVTIDRFGNAQGPFLPYTYTFTPFATAAGQTSKVFTHSSLSGSIPYSELNSRIRPGKGSINFTTILGFNTTLGTKGVEFQFSPNINFSTTTNIMANISAGNAFSSATLSVYKIFEGFCVSPNVFVFPSRTNTGLSTSTVPLTRYEHSDTNDLFFRFVFSAADIGSFFGLSGAKVQINP